MKKILLLTTIVLGIFISGNVLAEGFASNTKIVRISPHDFGEVVLIYLESDVTYPSGCSYHTAVALKRDHPFFKETFDVAMTALVAQKNVWGWMHGGCYREGTPGLGMPYVIRLDIIQ